MKDNTPPSSPRASEELDVTDAEDIDIGEVEEVYELDDDADLSFLDRQGDEEDMEAEEEEAPVDMASTIFSQHKGSVFVCSTCTDGNVATGGEDDLAHIWDPATGALRFTCTGHKDSVICVQYSHDGLYLATGDMGGLIQVWKTSDGSKIWEFETGDLSWLSWHHGSHVLLAGTTEGDLWMWLIPQGNARTFPSFGSASQCGAFLPDGKRAISGYEDGSVRVFDLKSGDLKHQFSSGLAHSTAVTCIAVHKDNTLALTGSVDGTAKLFNTLNGKVVGTFDCNISPGSQDDEEEEVAADNTVEAVTFCPTIPSIAVTTTLSGFVIIWEISTQVIRHIIAQGCGSSQLIWHPSEPIVITACLDGIIRLYDVRSGDLLKKYTGHSSSIFYIDISKDGSSLVTASDDGTSRVFRINES